MKIAFVGDYSNVHACLAGELRRRGHDVTVIGDGGGFQRTPTDRHVARGTGFIGSAKYLWDVIRAVESVRGYDVVQLINPHFFDLRASKLRYLFRELRRNNRSTWLTLAGNDFFFVKAATEGSVFRFSEYRIGSEPTLFVRQNIERERGWLNTEVENHARRLYDEIDGAMALLPEYYMAAHPILGDRCHFTNLPIDLATHPFSAMPDMTDGVRVAVGMKGGMETQKGTDILLSTALELERELNGLIRVEKVTGLTYSDYLKKIASSHVVIDQLYSYSPATNALDTMALGRVAASGAQPEYYDFIGETSRRPIICLQPTDTDLKSTLRNALTDRERLFEMGRRGREIVERHNDVSVVASKFIDRWTR